MPANDDTALPDELIDLAAELFGQELDHWKIVGPLQNGAQTFFVAARDSMGAGYHPAIIDPTKPVSPAAGIEHTEFKEKIYAIMYLQWRGLKTVLNDEAFQAQYKELLTTSNG